MDRDRSSVAARSVGRSKPRGVGAAALTGVAALFAGGFLLAMVVWPLAAVFQRSLGDVGPSRLMEILERPSVGSVLAFTVGQALLSAVVTLVLGLPVAHLLARYDFIGKSLLRAAVVVPFVLPTVVVAAAVGAVVDRLGFASGVDRSDTISLAAIIYAHTFFNLAVVVRLVGGFWARLDRRQVEAARMLGASPAAAWWSITFRQLRPAIVGSGLIVFLFSFTSFGVIRVLGGLRTTTLETEIHRYAITRAEFDTAAVLALIQIVVVAGLSIFSARTQRRYTVAGSAARPMSAGSVAGRSRVLVALAMAIVVVVHGVPTLLLVAQSLLVNGRLSADHYMALAVRVDILPISALAAIGNSLMFAAAAAVVAVAVGIAATVAITRGGRIGRVLEALTFVPLGVSAVTLGFGYLVGFAAFDLRQSTWLVPVAHSVVGLPFVVAAMVPAARSVSVKIREAAAVLGASPSQVWRTIEWPIVRRAAITGAGFAAAVSIGEFGATSFLARGEQSFTAPLAIFRLLSTPGEALRGQALALSVVVGIVVAGVALAMERRRQGSVTLL